MRKFAIALGVLFACLLAQQAPAAIKYKRFPHCPEGGVGKTCECHAGTSGRYEFCYAGHYCDTFGGVCASLWLLGH